MAHVELKKSPGLKKKTAEIYPGKCRSKGPTSHTPNFSRFSNSSMGVFTFFPSDCGVCNLSCHDCSLNYRKATGVSRFFCTCCFVFNINRHLPCLSYPRNHRRMWTTVTGSSNNWLYYKASHHGPR